MDSTTKMEDFLENLPLLVVFGLAALGLASFFSVVLFG